MPDVRGKRHSRIWRDCADGLGGGALVAESEAHLVLRRMPRTRRQAVDVKPGRRSAPAQTGDVTGINRDAPTSESLAQNPAFQLRDDAAPGEREVSARGPPIGVA